MKALVSAKSFGNRSLQTTKWCSFRFSIRRGNLTLRLDRDWDWPQCDNITLPGNNLLRSGAGSIILEKAVYISFHLVGGERVYQLFGAELLRSRQGTIGSINTSRGGCA